jgi:hypothetical protein
MVKEIENRSVFLDLFTGLKIAHFSPNQRQFTIEMSCFIFF